MRLIDPKTVSKQINKCYLEYDPEWQYNFREDRVLGFKYYFERSSGLRLDFIPKQDRLGRHGYELQQVAVVDEPKYLMWMLRYS
jgi:hypothetical protein